MEVLGLGIVTIALFVAFGLLIGILFGFFGMGGSFVVTPVLLVLGYPAKVAVGSGLAFVFGTGVVGALRHRYHGQVDYKLAALTGIGMTPGIEVGKRVVFRLEELGSADFAIGAAYVVLLGVVGIVVLRDTRSDETHTGPLEAARASRLSTLPPSVSLAGDATTSVWVILASGFGIGTAAGCLGVGGGFLLLPVMTYGFGVPAATAVGTSVLPIVGAGAFGTYVYALSNAVDVPVVTALLCGSTLGVRIGVGATRLVSDADIRGYFAIVLLASGAALAIKQVSYASGSQILARSGAVLVVGTTILVSAAIVYTSIGALRGTREYGPPPGH